MQEKVLATATFNPAVKFYWLITLLLVSTLSVVGIPLLLISIPLFFIISSKILSAMSAIITERKLIVKRGVFNKEEKSIPLEKITDVAMVQGPLMRIFNLYRLSFETAGQSSNGALVSLLGIEDAANFRETILTQKDCIATGATLSESNNNKAVSEDKADMAALLSSVRRIEMLLEKLVETDTR